MLTVNVSILPGLANHKVIMRNPTALVLVTHGNSAPSLTIEATKLYFRAP